MCFKNVFMAVYQRQALELLSSLFASFYSTQCVLPHFEVLIKYEKYEGDFLEWNGMFLPAFHMRTDEQNLLRRFLMTRRTKKSWDRYCHSNKKSDILICGGIFLKFMPSLKTILS